MLKRYTKKVIISYDSDGAGQAAADKAFRLLGEVGVETKILRMNGAKDPDEYIKKFGTESFRKLIEGSQTEFDYKFGKILAKYDFGITAEKIKALDESEKLIAQVLSAAEREIYIHVAAPKLGITPDVMKRDIDRFISKRDKIAAAEESKKIMLQSEGYGDRTNPDYIKNPKAAAAEEAILALIILHPEYLREISKNGDPLTEDEMFTAFGKKVCRAVLSAVEESEDNSSVLEGKLGEFLEVDEVSRVTKICIARRALTNNTLEVLCECRKTLAGAKQRSELDIQDIINMKRKKSDKAGN
jgi:DNA primase